MTTRESTSTCFWHHAGHVQSGLKSTEPFHNLTSVQRIGTSSSAYCGGTAYTPPHHHPHVHIWPPSCEFSPLGPCFLSNEAHNICMRPLTFFPRQGKIPGNFEEMLASFSYSPLSGDINDSGDGVVPFSISALEGSNIIELPTSKHSGSIGDTRFRRWGAGEEGGGDSREPVASNPS